MKTSVFGKWFLFVALLPFIAACDSDGDARHLSNLVVVASEGYTTMEISEAASVISVGQTDSLSAIATGDNGPSGALTGVVWSSGDTSIATVSGDGVVTGGSIDGPVTISARFGNLFSSTPIRVSSAPLSEVRVLVDGVSIDNIPVNECSTVQLTASGIYLGEEGEPRDISDRVVWTVAPAENAAFDVSTTGLLRTEAAGALTVSARFDASSSAIAPVAGLTPGTQLLTVRDNLGAIEIRPDEGALDADNPLQFRAYTVYTDGTEETEITDNVVWEIEGVGDSNIGEVVGGLVTASRFGAGRLTASCAGESTVLNILSGNGDEIDQIVIDQSDPVIRNFSGVDTLSLTASTTLNGIQVEDITEDAIWRVRRPDGNLVLSNVEGSKGEVRILGVGEIEVEIEYTADDGQVYTSASLTVTVR